MDNIYSLRKSFSIIGLTGRIGSGCSKVAEILASTDELFFQDDNELRTPEAIKFSEAPSQRENIFKRKYNICYKFLKKNRINYTIIDYKKSVILYCINQIAKLDSAEKSQEFAEFITKAFTPALSDDKALLSAEIFKDEILEILHENNFNLIVETLFSTVDELSKIKSEDDFKIIYNLFFNNDSDFSILYEKILNLMTMKSPYLRSLFFHKVSNAIRSSPNIINSQAENTKDTDGKNLYNMAKLINRLIKCFKYKNPSSCHIAIDSLKNSLEAMFFKERYSAFYLVAVHNHKQYDNIKTKSNTPSNYEALKSLDEAEYKCNDFREGKFYAPDVQNCIQKSEIHLSKFNHDKTEADKTGKNQIFDFFSIKEQILKYHSLILQPGIITPSSVERCMQIAYNAKLNSGCISRQVGAVLTDSTYSVKAVGWNDAPAGSTPCLLRNIEEVIGEIPIIQEDKTYSPYETQHSEEFKYKANKKKLIIDNEEKHIPLNNNYIGKTFSENAKIIYSDKTSRITEKGKNCSFCFKSLQNTFEGEQNQVHTRSLHAEENAMLQISKHGGQALENGVLFTTASPCELCSKKAYQLGIRKIIYIDPYPGISMLHVLKNGFSQPSTEAFRGTIGKSFTKLYEPFLSYKDELNLIMANKLD